MQETLLICSKSTREYFPDIKKHIIVSGKLQHNHLKMNKTKNRVIAVGGGAVIDMAKIISQGELVCYPTTASGACYTSHSVIWKDKKKLSVKTRKASSVVIEESFLNTLPEDVINDTKCDLLSHCIDSINSVDTNKESESLILESLEILKSSNSLYDLIYAGNLAGMAIEITPTTILHSLSYPLTGYYGFSHGRALGLLLPIISEMIDFDLDKYATPVVCLDKVVDFDFVVNQAKSTRKFKNFKRELDLKKLVYLLKKRYGFDNSDNLCYNKNFKEKK